MLLAWATRVRALGRLRQGRGGRRGFAAKGAGGTMIRLPSGSPVDMHITENLV